MRGFMPVRQIMRKNYTIEDVNVGQDNFGTTFQTRHYPDLTLPTRADARSAGYDFYSPVTIGIQPKETVLIWTDVKACMLPDEYLAIHIRSSLGIKHGLILANNTGIIDSSYFNNPENDGNIGLAIYNNSDEIYIISEGDRIAQGIFQKYYIVDNDVVLQDARTGGSGSSGK